jgi:hypothetical protein
MSSQAIDSRDLLIEAYGAVMAPPIAQGVQPGVIKVGTSITYRQTGPDGKVVVVTGVVDAAQKFAREGKIIWRYHTKEGHWVRNSDVLSIVHKENALDIEPTPDAAKVGNANAGAATEATDILSKYKM